MNKKNKFDKNYTKGEIIMNFNESKTLKNLTRAFAAECQDGAFYQYRADEATQQKLSNVATILKQLATSLIFYHQILLNQTRNFVSP